MRLQRTVLWFAITLEVIHRVQCSAKRATILCLILRFFTSAQKESGNFSVYYLIPKNYHGQIAQVS